MTSGKPQISAQRSAFSNWKKAFCFPALLGALLVGAVFVAERAFYVDPDAWWHLKVGESILQTHRWPTADPYSFTVPGSPWMAYEWLGDVLLAGVQRAAGLRGLAGLEIALAAATALALYALATLRCGNSKAGFVACVLLLMLAEVSFTLRPQMLGYLFLVLAVIALERFRQGKLRALWILPPLFLLWVNTHGSFMIGVGAIAVYWASGLVPLRRDSGFGVRGSPQEAVEDSAGADLKVSKGAVALEDAHLPTESGQVPVCASPRLDPLRTPSPEPRTPSQWGGLEARRWTPAQRQRLALVFLLCLLALTITPYGTRLAVYPLDVAFAQPLNLANIQEWQSMPFNMWFGKLLLVLLLGFLVSQLALRPAWRLEEIVLFLVGTLMACLYARFILVFVPFFTPLLATLLARWVPPYDRAKDKYALNALVMVLIAAGLVGYFPSQAELRRTVAEKFPTAAVEYLRGQPALDPVYNNYSFGGYLIYALGPERKVFIDGRADIYERGGVLSDYARISLLKPEAMDLLRGYGVKSCLLVRDEALVTLLAASPDWQQVYADKVSALFVRRDGLFSHRDGEAHSRSKF